MRDRLWNLGGKVRTNPWLAVGLVVGLLLVSAWIGWAIHVGSDKGGREAIGVLVAWPAIAAVIALLSFPFVWAFRVIRASRSSSDRQADAEPESADAEMTEPS